MGKQDISVFLLGTKFIYLVLFFGLLSGFFYPLVRNTDFSPVIGGIFVLFLGLGGVYLIYFGSTVRKYQYLYFGGGFAISGLTCILIYIIAGRPII